VDMGFIKVDDDLYKITSWGENAYNVLTKSEVADLSLDVKGYDEKILVGLLSGSKSYNELVGIVRRGSLDRSLKSYRVEILLKSLIYRAAYSILRQREDPRGSSHQQR